MMKPPHGIFNIHKPIGMSSHDVVNHVRRTFATRRVGHAGTLDVEASGVLLVGINEGTKLLHYLQHASKHYAFGVTFGTETDTLDHTGKPLNSLPVNLPDWLDCEAFVGTYEQTPPAYSAVKVAGKKLYEYAREGKPIPEVPPRTLTVTAFTQNAPLKREKDMVQASFEVKASSGLYVRKLALDLAKHHGTLAHTHYIHRLAVGTFTIENAKSLDTLDAHDVIRLSEALPGFDDIYLDQLNPEDVAHGRALEIPRMSDQIKVVNAAGDLFGLYYWTQDKYRPLRMFKGD